VPKEEPMAKPDIFELIRAALRADGGIITNPF
jgi:hypothetical protein